MTISAILPAVIQILYALTIISLVFLIIFEKRNPQKTVSWILVLVFLPVVGLIIYVVFGENHRRLRKVNRRMNKGLAGIPRPSFSHSTQHADSGNEKLKRLLEKTNDAPLIEGNKIDLLPDGKERFSLFFEDIKNARHHIHLLYYTFSDDELGNRLAALLCKKAKEGVEVRVIYDGVGSIKSKGSFFRKMAESGVSVEEFLPVRFWRFMRRVNYRNHRKIAVIDGRVGYTGGRNISDCYENGLSWGVWRDLDIRIEGEGIYGLQKTFLTDWYYAHKENVNGREYFPELENMGGNSMQVVSSGPTDTYESIASGIFEAICGAEKCVYIETPYFIPNDQVIRAMQVAAMSGVDVRLTLSAKSDSLMVNAAGFSFIDELLAANVKVYLFKPGFLHAKSIVVDDNLFVTGSANMDIRSFELNFETCAFVYSKETAQAAKKLFMKNLKESRELDSKTWKKRSRIKRAYESLMRIISPVF